MHTSSFHMNGGSYELNLKWDLLFIWEGGVHINGTPGVPNNFSINSGNPKICTTVLISTEIFFPPNQTKTGTNLISL